MYHFECVVVPQIVAVDKRFARFVIFVAEESGGLPARDEVFADGFDDNCFSSPPINLAYRHRRHKDFADAYR